MREKMGESSWLELWRRQKTAPPEEQWKWSWGTWRPVFEALMAGPIDHERCPVCGQRTLRYYFLLVSKRKLEGEVRYGAERWVGCDTCRVQHHDRGLLPGWIDAETVEWAGPLRKRYEGGT